jgi:beta-glucosidase
MTLSMAEYVAVDGAEDYAADHREKMEDQFLDACRGDDFFGVQTYSRLRLGPEGMVGPEEGVELLPMGYEYWPAALEHTIRRAWEYLDGEVPILVTENGIGTEDDEQRRAYVQTALEGVLDTIEDGVDVQGYTYWSLLDNFEWIFGYRIHFGLVAVDRTTFERTPKPTARWLGEIAHANALEVAG